LKFLIVAFVDVLLVFHVVCCHHLAYFKGQIAQLQLPFPRFSSAKLS